MVNFGGKGDARGILARFHKSIKKKRQDRMQRRESRKAEAKAGELSETSSSDSEESEDPNVESFTNSFVDESQLGNFDPSGHADMSVTGTTDDAAFAMDFKYDETADHPAPITEGEAVGEGHEDDAEKAHHHHRRRSIELPVEPVEHTGAPENVSEVPKLSICMLVCGTRGDVQPFIALGLTLQEYGHRVRIGTHKDYREFVTRYGLEFFPLGGDPKVLSDFIVKHRGVFTVNMKDATSNVSQVEEIVFSCYDACTQPDPEDKAMRAFVAEAIIANPPSYGHIHVAEKLQIPCHIFFTMPWTPTRNFPHPLARIPNVRDTRPHSVAVRNYLSYLVVNEYTYTGLFSVFNRFREEKLGLEPVRFGSSGATLLDVHDVPFCYCWSPSLVAKPEDWDDHVDVSGYFFLNEGTRSKYEPKKELADFLAKGPPPVYLGFGSLMVDDRERLTKKILKAFEETGNRLLMSKGWAGLGEGFDLDPEKVMLLDDVPHDWLLPQCAAAIHHGGAGTTAASLLAACPTLVIPFFGDQTFWGSAVYRRGVGPKPIPIDSFSTKKLVTALKFMEKPEVKAEAEKIAAQIKAEDGVKRGMEAFHRHLPVMDIKAGKPTEWNLAKPTVGAFVHELAGGIGDIFWQPIKGAKEEGVKGAFKGVGKGLFNSVARPARGVGLAGASVWHQVSGKQGGPVKCLSMPQTKSFREEQARKQEELKFNKQSSNEITRPGSFDATRAGSLASSQPSEELPGQSSGLSRDSEESTTSGGKKLFKRRFLFQNKNQKDTERKTSQGLPIQPEPSSANAASAQKEEVTQRLAESQL